MVIRVNGSTDKLTLNAIIQNFGPGATASSLTESVSGKWVKLFTGQTLEHEAAHTDIDVGLGVIGSLLIVAGETAGLV